jgi:hypothetical protein
MNRRVLMVLILATGLAAPASAGILFGKKPNKPSPAERVPELLATAKSDGDENKRIDAVQELQQYDPTAFPDMAPILIDVLNNDPKPGVRAEAAQTLSRLRPVSQDVGAALEQSVAKDPSMRVRLQARSALLQYRWSGFKEVKKDPPPVATPTKDAPIVGPVARPKTPPPVQTKEPPLAPIQQTREPPPAPRPAPPAPMPVLEPPPATIGPAPQPLPPAPPLPTTPAPAGGDQGPDLAPPPE